MRSNAARVCWRTHSKRARSPSLKGVAVGTEGPERVGAGVHRADELVHALIRPHVVLAEVGAFHAGRRSQALQVVRLLQSPGGGVEHAEGDRAVLQGGEEFRRDLRFAQQGVTDVRGEVEGEFLDLRVHPAEVAMDQREHARMQPALAVACVQIDPRLGEPAEIGLG